MMSKQRNLDSLPLPTSKDAGSEVGGAHSDRSALGQAQRVASAPPSLAVVMTDLSGNVTSVDPAIERLTGYSAADLLDWPVTRLFAPERAAVMRLREVYRLALRDGSATSLGWHVHKDGTPYWVEATLTPLYGADATPSAMLCALRPLTPAPIATVTTAASTLAGHPGAVAEPRAHPTSEFTSASIEQQDAFLTILSHELKTPLTSLKMVMQLARRRVARGRVVEDATLEQMELAVRRIERLVNDLLDSSRIERDDLPLRRERLDLVDLCQSAAAQQRAATGRTILLALPEGSAWASVDAEHITQVVTNLLANALKYSPAEQPVTLHLCIEAHRAVICISDNGPGIAPNVLPHLFERYYRAPGIEVQSGSGIGLGLGLFISREIVERHGGQIWVESCPGQGSSFAFSLPLAVGPTDET